MSIAKQIDIPSLIKIGDGKLRKIGKYLVDRGFTEISIFFSEGIEPLVAGPLYEGLAEHNINIIYKYNVSQTDIETIIHTAFKIPQRTSVLLGIGGGKALDYSKYAAHVLQLPFISVPTSISNDGFCSPGASLLVEGKRKSVKASIPNGVVMDLDIIKTAPVEGIYSGIGDMVSKVSALFDWKEAFVLKLSDHNDFAAMVAYNSVDILYGKQRAKGIAPEFYYDLSNSLLMSGIAMEIAGTSRPASGSEHLISHALDQLGSKRMHGLQVGTASYLCALLQNNRSEDIKRFLTDTGFVDFVKQNPFNKTDFINALKIAPQIKENYYTVLSRPDSFGRAVSFIENDRLLKELIK